MTEPPDKDDDLRDLWDAGGTEPLGWRVWAILGALATIVAVAAFTVWWWA